MSALKRVAIVQSNYIPWKGYFDMIAAVDEFILYDDVQYTRRDWRNRNQIKSPQGLQWLTIPVQVKGKYEQTIYQTKVDGSSWRRTHWKALIHNYHRAPHFKEICTWLEPLYFEQTHEHLSTMNRIFIQAICDYLGIKTLIRGSCDYTLAEGKTARLVDLCMQAKASEYISGPAAKSYIKENFFTAANIKLTWFDYNDYSEYPQLWGKFVHGVSILDLLFNCGQNSYQYMKYIKSQKI